MCYVGTAAARRHGGTALSWWCTRWHDGTVVSRWRTRWHSGTVVSRWLTRWHGGTVARWHGGTVARWCLGGAPGNSVARWWHGGAPGNTATRLRHVCGRLHGGVSVAHQVARRHGCGMYVASGKVWQVARWNDNSVARSPGYVTTRRDGKMVAQTKVAVTLYMEPWTHGHPIYSLLMRIYL